MLLIFCLSLITVGCENSRYNDGYYDNYYYDDYPRYVTVEVNAYTSYVIEVYIGDAFVDSIEPGRYQSFSKSLYEGEELHLRFVVYNQNGEPHSIPLDFDNDYTNYHVNVYDDGAESY